MATGKWKKRLLDDDDDAEAVEPEKLKLGYNDQYAKRFEHNKKREDLHRLQELQKNGLVKDSDNSSSEEEDNDGLFPAKIEERIFETLTKIKAKDPIIYSGETKFFDEDEEENEDEEEKPKLKKQKPLYLKDVNAQQALEGYLGESDDEEARKPKKTPLGYLSEQDELKRAFLEQVRAAEEGDGDDLLRPRKRTAEELQRDAEETEAAVKEAEQRSKDKHIAKSLEEYFGKDDELNENEKFLKQYLLNKGWIVETQKPNSGYPNSFDDAEDLSEDERALEKQDQFEKDYNFRFESGADITYVKGHSRLIENSVRKMSETRKKQREKKREREEEAERARREELKRLKNVKKKEVLEKLSKIRAVAGASASGGVDDALADDLDEDFNPEEYDKKMREAFGEEYYGEGDPDFVGGQDYVGDIEKPDFDAEDELLGITTEGDGQAAGFEAVKAKLEEKKKKKKKLKVPFDEKLLIDKHFEEYYKLDYEDVVGDLQTRFKYRPVKPNKYGLRTKDILGLEDKELTQHVPLKKLAPYAVVEWEARKRPPRLSSKARKKKALQQ